MKPIESVLARVVDRLGIRQQVEASQIVEAANAWLDGAIPSDLRPLVQAVSYKNKAVHFVCVLGAVSAFIEQRQGEVIAALCARVPQAEIERLSLRVASLPSP